MWVVALYLAAACCGVSGRVQPISCNGDQAQCGEGYYCETLTDRCFECLHCEDVNREPPSILAQSFCVKSFVDCGQCFKGLVAANQGDNSAQCVSPDSQQQSPVLPLYVWVLIAVAVVIVVVFIVGLYLYRKPETFKVWASTSIRSLCDRPSESQTAPDLPPPYNPDYNYVSNPNPSYDPPRDWSPPSNEDTAQPLIKRAPSSQPLQPDAREAADNQTARVFNRPAYSYQTDDSLSSPEPTEDRHDKYPVATPWMPLDEDTVPSAWTPHEDANDADKNNGAGVSTAEEFEPDSTAVAVGAVGAVGVPGAAGVVGAAAVGAPGVVGAIAGVSGASLQTALVAFSPTTDASLGPSAAKRLRTAASQPSQDSNNNRHRDSSAGPSASSSTTNQQPSSDSQTSVIINFVVNHTK